MIVPNSWLRGASSCLSPIILVGFLCLGLSITGLPLKNARAVDAPTGPVIAVDLHDTRITLQVEEAHLSQILGAIASALEVELDYRATSDPMFRDVREEGGFEDIVEQLLQGLSSALSFEGGRTRDDGLPSRITVLDRGATSPAGTASANADRQIASHMPLKQLGAAARRPKLKDLDDFVTALSSDYRPFARRIAIAALGRMTGEAARDATIAALEDEDKWVRRRAVTALAKGWPTMAEERLAGLLTEDPAPDVRREAILALWRLKPEASQEVLLFAQSDSSPKVRNLAIALSKLAQ